MFALACNLPKGRRIFAHRNYVKKNTWKQREFFDQRNYIKKSTWKQHGLFGHRSYIEKVCQNKLHFLTIKSTSKKYVETTWIFRPSKLYRKSENNVEFLTSKITWKKLRISNVVFSISENKSKRYVEMRWKFAKIWSWCIDVISTWNWHRFDLVCPLGSF